uniref:Pseudouridine synthase RsuA/RluA-like domain-containing protein n=1 Tax=Capsella rubella TaxID=81985 RepID=K4FQE7_9BRAS|nr:hypothetical protein 34G24.17 [Capsella rubella]
MKRKQQEDDNDDGVEKKPVSTTVVATSSNTMSTDHLILQSSSKLSHKQDYIFHGGFRHEPPVMIDDVVILHQEPDVVTVCKPASVPIEGGLVKKRYIAKVIGVFPEDEDAISSGDDKKVKGKPACTKFTRIATNGTHSLVSCEPVTGRTHQIRVHLQYTGHPIANDPLYLNQQIDNLETYIAKRIDAGERKIVSPDDYVYSTEDFSIDPMCTNCPKLIPQG